MRALVVGADGFAGRWLLQHLAEAGDNAHAAVGGHFQPPLPHASRITQLDVRDGDALDACMRDARPDVVYYLAGVSHRGGRDAVAAAVGVTVVGSLNALQAAARLETPPRLVYVSSGYVYRESDRPLREDDPTAPDGLYAIAKLAGEHAIASLAPAAGVDFVIARPFNHIGPGQKETFLVPFVARQVADVINGRRQAIQVRSTDEIRDFSDVRDVVRGYRLIALKGESGGRYNLSSGAGVQVLDIVQRLLEIAETAAKIEVIGSSHTLDAAAPSILIGDAGRAEGIGWVRTHHLHETLRDVLAQYVG